MHAPSEPIAASSVVVAATARALSRLAPMPRDLYMLWDEYESGLNGNKAAKEFTYNERGACRKVYSFRKKFWSTVERMIMRNHSSRTAIDKIYSVVGTRLCVTRAIKALTPQVITALCT